jgi:hypothetical protein
MQPSRSGPLQHLQLMAERKDLEVQRGTRAEDSPEHRQNRDQYGRHSEQSVPAPAGKFNGTNMYEVFTRYRADHPIRSRIPASRTCVVPVKVDDPHQDGLGALTLTSLEHAIASAGVVVITILAATN